MKNYLYFIYDHLAGVRVAGPKFTTKADARRLRNTMNALDGTTIYRPHIEPPHARVELRYTINRVETIDTTDLNGRAITVTAAKKVA